MRREPEDWLAILRPCDLYALIVEMLEREGGQRQTLGVAAIAAAILERRGYTPGPERGRAYPALAEAIAMLAAQVEGLRYVPGMA
jgi:hypothetical protein